MYLISFSYYDGDDYVSTSEIYDTLQEAAEVAGRSVSETTKLRPEDISIYEVNFPSDPLRAAFLGATKQAAEKYNGLRNKSMETWTKISQAKEMLGWLTPMREGGRLEPYISEEAKVKVLADADRLREQIADLDKEYKRTSDELYRYIQTVEDRLAGTARQ